MRERLEGGDHRALKRAIDDLNTGTTEFAARRMNRNIRKALTGQRVDEIGV